MPQQAMTERDAYLATLDREYETTLRVIRAYPADKLDLRPSPRSKSARDLIWMLVISHGVPQALLQDAMIPQPLPPAPSTHAELVAAFERTHRDVQDALAAMTEQHMQGTLRMPVGPGQVSDVPRSQALWMMLYDTIHHRGQLSVYLRMAGSVLPPIYGPTLEQPWW